MALGPGRTEHFTHRNTLENTFCPGILRVMLDSMTSIDFPFLFVNWLFKNGLLKIMSCFDVGTLFFDVFCVGQEFESASFRPSVTLVFLLSYAHWN